MHDGFSIRHIDVKLAPNPKLSREVDSRLDRKASSRHEPTTVLSFQVVDIGSITMDFLTDRVARPMNEEVAVTRSLESYYDRHHRLPIRKEIGL